MSGLPVLHFRTRGLGPEQAFELWRELIAPMYDIDRAQDADLPVGATTSYMVGELMANHTLFGPQRVRRDTRKVDSTPDHVVFQIWRTGGFRGEVQGRPVTLGPRDLALADRRRTIDGRIWRADTKGIAVPRALLRDIVLERLDTRLDVRRGGILSAHISALYRRLPTLDIADGPVEAERFLAAVRRMFSNSAASDLLDGEEMDFGLFARAETLILGNLKSPALVPQAIADALRVSRATLYRVFAPHDGVMRHVQEQRLRTVRDVLSDPLDTRSIAAIAAEHGFTSPSFFSRRFSRRFGMPPGEWRRRHVLAAEAARQETTGAFYAWWSALGRGAGETQGQRVPPQSSGGAQREE